MVGESSLGVSVSSGVAVSETCLLAIATHGILDLIPVRSTTSVRFVAILLAKRLRRFLIERAAILKIGNYPQCIRSEPLPELAGVLILFPVFFELSTWLEWRLKYLIYFKKRKTKMVRWLPLESNPDVSWTLQFCILFVWIFLIWFFHLSFFVHSFCSFLVFLSIPQGHE